MKRIICLLVSIPLLVLAGCAGSSGDTTSELNQSAHLYSVSVKVIEPVKDSDNLFLTEALEGCADMISQGDTILVSASSTEISNILDAYQDNNSFRIYFPVANRTSDGVSINCFDIVQYDSAGKIIQQDE